MVTPLDKLSPRDREILRLVARGLPTKQIARELDPPCAAGTVKTHLKRVYVALGVANRAEAAALWVRAGGE